MLESEREYYSKMSPPELEKWLQKRQLDLFFIGQSLKGIESIEKLAESKRIRLLIKIEEVVITAEELVKKNVRVHLDTTKYPKAINDVLSKKIQESKLLRRLMLAPPKKRISKPTKGIRIRRRIK